MRYLVFLLFSVTVFAQQPILVKALSPADALAAQTLQNRRDQLANDQAAFDKHIVRDYLATKDQKEAGMYTIDSPSITFGTPTAPGCFKVLPSGMLEAEECSQTAKEKHEEITREAKKMWILNGWGQGDFEYSNDFKFIIPRRTPQTSRIINPCWNGIQATTQFTGSR